jgi:hypothetical protein
MLIVCVYSGHYVSSTMKHKSDHKILYAVACGLLVTLTGVLIDVSLLPFEKVIFAHQMMGDCIAGVVATLIFLALQLRHEEMHYRFAMEKAAAVGELNHHVRNAIFPLCVAVQRLGDAESNRIANEAVERINIALKEAAADVYSQKVNYTAPDKRVAKVA